MLNFKYIIHLFVLFPIFIIFLISGCSDKAVNQSSNGKIIEGKVVDYLGFPAEGIKVYLGSSHTITGIDGSFRLSSSTDTFDVSLVEDRYTQKIGTMYNGITISNPVLYIHSSPNTYNKGNAVVITPKLSSIQKAVIFFTDIYMHESWEIAEPPDSISVLFVKWNGANKITGKVICMVYSIINGVATSFEKYGEKQNIEVTKGGTTVITFTENDLNINPVESGINGNITGGNGNISSGFSLTTLSKTTGNFAFNYLPAISFEQGSNFMYVIPTGLPTPFRYIVNAAAEGNIYPEFSYKSKSLVSGSNNVDIALEVIPILSEPSEGAVNIDLNTIFDFNIGSGAGINEITFYSAQTLFYVFQFQKYLTLPDFSSMGIPIGSNINYRWSVRRICYYRNMDEFVSKNPVYNDSLVSVTSTKERNFTTKP